MLLSNHWLFGRVTSESVPMPRTCCVRSIANPSWRYACIAALIQLPRSCARCDTTWRCVDHCACASAESVPRSACTAASMFEMLVGAFAADCVETKK
jgi:hypothetical protein